MNIESNFSMHSGVRLQSVTPLAADYIRKWCTPVAAPSWQVASDSSSFGEFGAILARLLLAVGGGLARAPTCICAIRHLPGEVAPSHLTLLVRALSLLGPGELPVLRGADSTVLKLILSMLEHEDAETDPSQPTETAHATVSEARDVSGPTLSRALDSLRVLAWPSVRDTSEWYIVSLVKRYASTLEELDCPVLPLDIDDAWDRALATCTRLESLTYARRYAPSAWLGLSHLHTLRGVDLHHVSIEAIAVALPRLHTLEVVSEQSGPLPASAAAGFFECLLPRLRVFHFSGVWPKNDPAVDEPPRPLPLLHDLSWHCEDFVSGFAHAQPSKLCAPFRTMIADWLLSGETIDCDQAARGPLSCVRHLRILSPLPEPAEVASVLRAAPELRTLDAGAHFRGGLDWAADPAFEGLIHPRLRSIRVPCLNQLVSNDAYYYPLQQRHFPRLQEMQFEAVAAGDVVFL